MSGVRLIVISYILTAYHSLFFWSAHSSPGSERSEAYSLTQKLTITFTLIATGNSRSFSTTQQAIRTSPNGLKEVLALDPFLVTVGVSTSFRRNGNSCGDEKGD